MALACALPKFQEEKLQSLFCFFARSAIYDEEQKFNEVRLKLLYKDILDFTGWTEESTEAKRCKGVVDCFFESIVEKCNFLNQEEKADTEVETTESKGATMAKEGSLSLENWLRTWSYLLRGKKVLDGLPIWVNVLPKILLEIIDRDGDGVISFDELKKFYQQLLPKTKNAEEHMMLSAFNKMTGKGAYPLDIDSLGQLFSNFLIGQTPFAPGKYLFGCYGADALTPPKVNILRDFNEERDELDSATGTRRKGTNPVNQPGVPRPRKASLPGGRLVGSWMSYINAWM